ncbi:MAG: hypothetical protein MI750_16430 [Xanthomonadales bacterium]|nr:hypothetical protein [Xanthomonadales bacterium]
MIDREYKVNRYISVFDKFDESLVGKIDINFFCIEQFREWFGFDVKDPLIGSIEVTLKDLEFISKYIEDSSVFAFDKHEYFLEARAL